MANINNIEIWTNYIPEADMHELFISHDEHKDIQFIRLYNQVAELADLSLYGLIADYINEHT